MDFHWIIGQGGERKRGPSCRAPMIGHYSDFVSRISRSPKQLALTRVSGNTDLLLLEVSQAMERRPLVVLHQSSPTRWQWDVEKWEDRGTDRKRKGLRKKLPS